MAKTIALLTGETESSVAAKTRKEIETHFFRLIRKQTSQLEKETLDFSAS
jgi:hypothetical protein